MKIDSYSILSPRLQGGRQLSIGDGKLRQDKTILYLESYRVLCTSTFYPNNLKS